MNTKTLILIILPFLLISCGDSSRHAADDKIAAQTDYEYFQTSSQRIFHFIQVARKQLSDGDKALAEMNLDNAEKSVVYLLNYQIPLTEVRSLIHDSWRLYTDGRIQEMDRHFDQADELLEKIKVRGTQSLISVIEEIQFILSDVRTTVKKTRYAISNKYQLQDPSSVASKYFLLMEKINELISNDRVLPLQVRR